MIGGTDEALPEPDGYNVEGLRVWIKGKVGGKYCIARVGSEAWGKLYAGENPAQNLVTHFFKIILGIFWTRKSPSRRSDLVATKPHGNVDGLTRWVARDFVPFHHECKDQALKKCKKTSVDVERKATQQAGDKRDDKGCQESFATLENIRRGCYSSPLRW